MSSPGDVREQIEEGLRRHRKVGVAARTAFRLDDVCDSCNVAWPCDAAKALQGWRDALDHIETLQDKDIKCACDFENNGDVCEWHQQKLVRRLDAAESRNRALVEALERIQIAADQCGYNYNYGDLSAMSREALAQATKEGA